MALCAHCCDSCEAPRRSLSPLPLGRAGLTAATLTPRGCLSHSDHRSLHSGACSQRRPAHPAPQCQTCIASHVFWSILVSCLNDRSDLPAFRLHSAHRATHCLHFWKLQWLPKGRRCSPYFRGQKSPGLLHKDRFPLTPLQISAFVGRPGHPGFYTAFRSLPAFTRLFFKGPAPPSQICPGLGPRALTCTAAWPAPAL